ncbi:hypothetical protein CK203_088253 [Vitis vinifera]|uniref:Uncharacterized protein n=2 Tax=Vitis vinifera TaxID=29760 RepID=A0A438FJK9_VITVI|nr:hypothetical protein CK203_088253 [Vitis vinifera]
MRTPASLRPDPESWSLKTVAPLHGRTSLSTNLPRSSSCAAMAERSNLVPTITSSPTPIARPRFSLLILHQVILPNQQALCPLRG